MPLRVALEGYRRALGATFVSSRASFFDRAGLLFTLEDAQGAFGQGEAAPLPGYSATSLEECQRALAGVRPEALEALEALSLPALGVELARVLDGCPPEGVFAVETALLDLRARRAALPLHRLLEEWIGGPRAEALPLVAVLSGDPSEWERATRALVAGGHAGVKAKIGAPDRFEAELRALARVHEVLGGRGVLRLDANGALSPGQLAALAAFAPEFVEEPGPVSSAAPVPIALDESLRGGPDPSHEPAAVYVLKLGPLGGFSRAFAWCRAARASGRAVVISHTLEGPVGTGAAAELALALGPRQLAPGLGAHPGLAGWSCGLPAAYRGARLVAHREPGLGVARVIP